jgi:hypothetical protein
MSCIVVRAISDGIVHQHTAHSTGIDWQGSCQSLRACSSPKRYHCTSRGRTWNCRGALNLHTSASVIYQCFYSRLKRATGKRGGCKGHVRLFCWALVRYGDSLRPSAVQVSQRTASPTASLDGSLRCAKLEGTWTHRLRGSQLQANR